MRDPPNAQSTDLPIYQSARFLTDLTAVVLLWGLVIACYWRIALAGRVLAGGDVFTYFYPYWAEATRAVRAGRLPLWNPYLFMGAPFLANCQVGFFYPLNWPLWLLLPASRSVHLTIVLHLCLAAFNAYAWGRSSLRLGRVGAWTVGAVFALGGYLGAQVEHVNQLQGLAWLPLMFTLYDSARLRRAQSSRRRISESANQRRSKVVLNAPGPRDGGEVVLNAPSPRPGGEVVLNAPSPRLGGDVAGQTLSEPPPGTGASSGKARWSQDVEKVRFGERTRRRRSGAALIGLAVVIGLVVLAGHTQTAFILLVGLGIYGLGPVLWKGLADLLAHQSAGPSIGRPLVRRATLLVGAAALGIALAAVQLAPTWELSRLSVRAGGLPFNERVSFSLSPLYLARALLPGFADPVPPERIEHVAYVGIAGLALVAVAIYNTPFATRHTSPPFSTGSSRKVSGNAPSPRLGGAEGEIDHKSRPEDGAPSIFRESSTLQPAICLIAVGLFFALGLYNPLYLLLARYVPGFAHFRVPARWLVLYVVGAAGLAGQGAQALWGGRRWIGRRASLSLAVALVVLVAWAAVGGRLGEGGHVAGLTLAAWGGGIALALGLSLAASRAPRLATGGLLALLILELFAAGSTLPHWRATAPQAFTGLRPAIAHLLASSPEDGPARGRFLSMSDITFDPGDLPEIRTIYGPQLSDAALYDYVIAAKQKEVLSPNVPLAFGVPAVDGYGGGVLPLARYVALQRLFLPRDEVSLDGRLRENLSGIPDGRWLNLFNVRYVITDKLRDAWVDDVFYDLQLGARLSRGEEAGVAHVPPFEATTLGLVSHLDVDAALPDDAAVGLVEIDFGDGRTRTFTLSAEAWEGEEGEGQGDDRPSRLRWEEPSVPVTITVRGVLPRGEWVVRGVSLIDERTGGFQSLVLSDRGRFRLAHSGDVKIYENLGLLPRAFIVHHARVVADDEAALAAMGDPAFDPAAEVVLAREAASRSEIDAVGPGDSAPERAEDVDDEGATIVSYRPERVMIEAALDAPGFLVLTDAWYPGWEATVDGRSVPVRRADLLFRAIPLDAGRHRVLFTFRPVSLRVGAAISLVALIGLIVILAASSRYDGAPRR